jgi:hypothetical protein
VREQNFVFLDVWGRMAELNFAREQDVSCGGRLFFRMSDVVYDERSCIQNNMD